MNYKRLEEITEAELQAAGLQKSNYMFGYGHPIYADANNTYIIDKNTGCAWFTYRNQPEDNTP